MYQALYRKWRPLTFDEVIGQEHITQTLKSQVRNKRLSHAYLFIGTRGTGKTTCARILARAVNCEHPVDGNPCGHCAACRGILDGSIMDVVELDAASNNGVDNVRALREEAVYSPAAVKKRVYIIDEVHMLSMQAFNALLKILEEPPEHLMFILATTELQKVPATILSRCQRHSFHRLEARTIADYLLTIAGREHMQLEPEAAALIARLADGGVRDALSLLDQCSARETIDVDAVYSAVGLAGKRKITELLDAVLRHDTERTLSLFSAMWMDGKDPTNVLDELNSLLRDVLMLQVAPKAGRNLVSGGFDQKQLLAFSARVTAEELIAAMGSIQASFSALKDGKNPRTAAELCLVSLSRDIGGDSFRSVRARLSRLEEQMERGVPAAAPRTDPPTEAPVSSYSDEPEPPEPPAAIEPEPIPEAPVEAPPAESAAADADLWPRIRRAALDRIPADMRANLEDEARVSGFVEGSQLILETENAFLAGRYQRPDVVKILTETARAVSGRELRLQVRARSEKPRETRSLDELRQYKEVHFISE